MENSLERLIRRQIRKAGRQFEEAKHAYSDGQTDRVNLDDDEREADADTFDLPTDDDGNARIVCRRYAEKRAVTVDGGGHPACFDPTHPDCEGCVEDIRQGVIETWDEK